MQILEVPEAESDSEDDAPTIPVALRPRPSGLDALDRWSSWDVPSLTLPKAKRQGAGLRIATNPDFSSSVSQVSLNDFMARVNSLINVSLGCNRNP